MLAGCNGVEHRSKLGEIRADCPHPFRDSRAENRGIMFGHKKEGNAFGAIESERRGATPSLTLRSLIPVAKC